MKINAQGVINNLQNLAGVIVGVLVLRPLGLRFGKEHRSAKLYSTVAANLAADGICRPVFPFAVFSKKQ